VTTRDLDLPRPACEIVAQKLRHGGTKKGRQREAAAVTYSACATPQTRSADQRREPRRRTRLRAGKILDRANRFLVEAAIIERSPAGLRLRLARNIDVPAIFHFYDEESESLFLAQLAWRKHLIVGARRGPLVPANAQELNALRGKFYAMR
jgi:hypothetical protein